MSSEPDKGSDLGRAIETIHMLDGARRVAVEVQQNTAFQLVQGAYNLLLCAYTAANYEEWADDIENGMRAANDFARENLNRLLDEVHKFKDEHVEVAAAELEDDLEGDGINWEDVSE